MSVLGVWVEGHVADLVTGLFLPDQLSSHVLASGPEMWRLTLLLVCFRLSQHSSLPLFLLFGWVIALIERQSRQKYDDKGDGADNEWWWHWRWHRWLNRPFWPLEESTAAKSFSFSSNCRQATDFPCFLYILKLLIVSSFPPGLKSYIFQDSRAKYGKFVRPSRVIDEEVAKNNQTSRETENVGTVNIRLNSSLAGEQQELLGANVKGFGLEAGQKSRWEKCSYLCSANSSPFQFEKTPIFFYSAFGRSWELVMGRGKFIRRGQRRSLMNKRSKKPTAKDQRY